ncbi:MAG: hypothetical protein EBZ77_04655, partial [Chitinophagia bacterium]|nr:hypothetical protein [Chitinophagia bacterium]
MRLQQPGANRWVSKSALLFVVRLLPALATTFATILLSHRLPVAQYGLYTNWWAQANLLVPFVTLGVHSLLLTYPAPFFKQWLHWLRTKGVFIYLMAGSLAALLFALLQAHLPGAMPWVPFVYLMVFGLTIVTEALLVVLEVWGNLLLANGLYAVAYVALHVYSINTGQAIVWLMNSLMLALTGKFIITAWGAYQYTRHQQPDGGFVWQPIVMKSLWLHLALYDLIQLLSLWVDKFAVAALLPASISALYYNGTINIPFLPVLLGAVATITLTQLTRQNKLHQNDGTIQLMNNNGRLLSCIVFPLFFFLFTSADALVPALFGERYAAAVPVFMASICILPVRAYSFTTVLQMHHKGRIINLGAVAELVLAVALMYPLYRAFGLPGMAFS